MCSCEYLTANVQFSISASIFIAISVLSFRMVGLLLWLLIEVIILVWYNFSPLVESQKMG